MLKLQRIMYALMKRWRPSRFLIFAFFFFNDTATTEIYTLSLHDALPISAARRAFAVPAALFAVDSVLCAGHGRAGTADCGRGRSAQRVHRQASATCRRGGSAQRAPRRRACATRRREGSA